MKIAAHTLAWGNYYKDKHDISRALGEIKGLGFEGVELYEGLSQIDAGENFKGMLSKFSLGLASLSCNLNADEKTVDLEEAKLRANYAAKFAVKALMVCGGWLNDGRERSGASASPEGKAEPPRRGRTRDDGRGMSILAGKLDRLAEYTKQFGMDVAFHPHLGTIVETREDIDALLKASKNTKLCIDVAHLKAKGEDPSLLIKKYKDRLAYIHLKDWDENSKSFVPLGDGCVDIKGALQALDEVGYDGWITIELDEPKLEPKVVMGRGLEHMRSLTVGKR